MAIIMLKMQGMNDTIKYEFIEGNCIYIGDILTEKQKENLKVHHNTVISETMFRELGEKKILNEIKRLTGISCLIEYIKHDNDLPTIIVWQKGYSQTH